MDNYTAKISNLRMSPQKVGLVIDMVRGKSAKQAIDILEHTNKYAAKPVQKLITAALANASHNFSAAVNDLVVKEIFVSPATMLKRGKAVSRGRFFKILKRGSNLTVKLSVATKN